MKIGWALLYYNPIRFTGSITKKKQEDKELSVLAMSRIIKQDVINNFIKTIESDSLKKI